MLKERIDRIVQSSVRHLFAQIEGGRIVCQSEATLQLHLGRIISSVADLETVGPGEAFSIELEKPLGKGKLDIWFRLIDDDATECRCAIELKFFKKVNHREPNNRYDVFSDIRRLEGSKGIADVGYMLVATDHDHYVNQASYSPATADFDFRHDRSYQAGAVMTYKGKHGPPITLGNDYEFHWTTDAGLLRHLLLKVPVAG